MLHINAEWDNAYKILDTWLSDKCQVTLDFLAEVFLAEVLLSSLSISWTLRFLNSSCVLQLGSLLPFTEPHIWLCPKKRESRGVTHPSPWTCPRGLPLGSLSWTWMWLALVVAIWLLQLIWGLILLYPSVSLKEELIAERGKEESYDSIFQPPASQWPQTL